MIRALRPTDAVAYFAFSRPAPRNAAVGPLGAPRDGSLRDGASWQGATLRGFISRSFGLEPHRENWVQIEHGRISGLISARRRQGADVWDIDELVVPPAPDADRTCGRLIDQLLRAALDEGVQKIYVRIPAEDEAIDPLLRGGFHEYSDEAVFVRAPTASRQAASRPLGLRPRRAKDHQALFQLYCQAVPPRVRQAEAMTLQEWRWLDGWEMRSGGLHRRLWGGRADYVVQDDLGVSAWLRIDSALRAFWLLDDRRDGLDRRELIEFALGRLGGAAHAFCIVRGHQGGLEPALETCGFTCVARHALLTRVLATRMPEFKLVPVGAL